MKPWAILLLPVCLCLRADPETQFMERIYAKLAASYSATGALEKDGDILILAQPGVPLTPELLGDESGLAQLVDQVPRPAMTWVPSGGTCSGIYQAILEKSETSAFQNQSTRQQALEARRYLFDRRRPGRPSEAYQAYRTYRLAYYSALDDLESALAENKASGAPVPAGLEARKAAAYQDWEKLGNLKEVDKALKALETLYSENVKAIFESLDKDFASAKVRGAKADYYPIVPSPPAEKWIDSPAWKSFQLTAREANLHTGPPKLRILPSAESQGTGLPPSFLGSIYLSAKFLRVVLDRTWLDFNVFTSHGWRFPKESGLGRVSSGTPEDPAPGSMPLMVTGLLLSKDLVIRGSWPNGQAVNLKALGPFALAGKAGGTSMSNKTITNGELSIQVPGAQILGFLCTSIPRSPSPDLKAFRTP